MNMNIKINVCALRCPNMKSVLINNYQIKNSVIYRSG